MGKVILNRQQILQKIKRIAFEIYENNFHEYEIVLIGVKCTGDSIVGMLKVELVKISTAHITTGTLMLDKENPANSDIKLDMNIKNMEGKSVIIVDDVLNSGRVITYCLQPFLAINPKKLEVAVLINRSHKTFPIFARYKGYDLSTTLEEHISVVIDGDKTKAVLY